jgi:hypothetical protein
MKFEIRYTKHNNLFQESFIILRFSCYRDLNPLK